ncbi:hypothetical protein [Pseudofrankia sp. BMG5.37]|uniref:hypothetical protein n=1 Tax=Pseudofrankia sp. BMG5.37 TaxID=3050035 RepID=UPI002895A7A6|nr:hypothetical protein [Pseudofrankia sp. BMG5.37]MDT3446033.1 hypothetical protein [Pseudofrankia sp. BMG5.37]
MRGLLDDETLDGAHVARITYRPARIALPVSSTANFLQGVQDVCQLWGGATAPLVPVDADGVIRPEYARLLAGAAVDGVYGMHRHGLFNLPTARATDKQGRRYPGIQMAVALLKHGQPDDYRTVETIELAPNDPWKGIYAACLGLLPEHPASTVLHDGGLRPDLRFEEFVNISRISSVGSLDDLLARATTDNVLNPRELSMVHLPYGNSGSSTISAENYVLPDPRFVLRDAGPNIVVVCSPEDLGDLTLLWNLRSAHGDASPLPIGVPVAEATPDLISKLIDDRRIPRGGFSTRSIYVTSSSLSVDQLSDMLGQPHGRDFGLSSCDEIISFGRPAGWSRDEALVWKQGTARFVPMPPGINRELFTNRALGISTHMHADLDVLGNSFPHGDDLRIQAPNSAFYAGALSYNSMSVRYRSRPCDAIWPSRLLMARSVARRRSFDLRESEPGRAARIALAGLGDITHIDHIIHAPLLSLLEEMAARQGFGWFKDRLRISGQTANPIDAVPPTTDELPVKSFGDFKKVFGNNQKATKYWLLWAEKAKLIVKGFPLHCGACEAKQWIPVTAFAPPIICRGCAKEIAEPFGDRHQVDFKYRLSEPLRRVYEHDAIGHLLVTRYLYTIFRGYMDSNIVGLHPGMEIWREGANSAAGEADVLLLTKGGDFVPVEVKRSSTGFSEREVLKLNQLASILNSPWSVAATCQYAQDISDSFPELEQGGKESARTRVILSYDTLLEPSPFWTLDSDPFEWRPLEPAEIEKREAKFIRGLTIQADRGPIDWLSDEMLEHPSLPAN